MSSSSQTPTQTPTQIFAQLMATGAIDRFRKSLEKLIQPLSQARHQSISNATKSFLHGLVSVEDIISNPKKLLQHAKDATMTSAREDVVKDVQQTAVSEAAVELRRTLRKAFDAIIEPPKEQPKPEPQSTRITQPQKQATNKAPPEIGKALSPPNGQLPNPNGGQENSSEALDQTPSPLRGKAQANDQSAQRSTQGSQNSEFANGINAFKPSASGKTPPKTKPISSIQTIPTDLFQTAHNILELKSKKKEGDSSLAEKENRKNEPTETQAASLELSSPKPNTLQCLASQDRPASESPKNPPEAPSRAVDFPYSEDGLLKEDKKEAVEGENSHVESVDKSCSPMPQTSSANELGHACETAKMRRRSQEVADDPKRKARGGGMSEKDPDAETPRSSKKRVRKPRKSSDMPVADEIPTPKRRRKSQAQLDSNIEVEEGSKASRKRGRREIESDLSGRPRKAHKKSPIAASKGSERITEKRTGRKRGKGYKPVLNPAVAVLIDPQNPNRPRRYGMSNPSCVPKDYEAQVQVLEILENLLENDCASSFAEPVDLGDEGQSSYLQVIKNPMDLGTIVNRLKEGTSQLGHFRTVNEVLADIELVWWNCAQFNGSFDPVVEDMARCRVKLSLSFECLAIGCDTATIQQGRSQTQEKNNGVKGKARAERSKHPEAASKTAREEKVKNDSENPRDLNNGRLLGKQGVIFRYVENEDGKKRKEWSPCTITEYDAASRSYTILWEDKTETRNATIGPGCIFNIHRFRAD
ncbi:unnamed protein product [Agarophyton chilense]